MHLPVRQDEQRLHQADVRLAITAHRARDELLCSEQQLRMKVGAEEFGRRGENRGEEDGRRAPHVFGGVKVPVEEDDVRVQLRVEQLEELRRFKCRKNVCEPRTLSGARLSETAVQ